MSLSELRKTLRATVRGAWARPEMIEAQDALSAAAERIREEYKKCAHSAVPITECYARAAEAAGLGRAYRELWRGRA